MMNGICGISRISPRWGFEFSVGDSLVWRCHTLLLALCAAHVIKGFQPLLPRFKLAFASLEIGLSALH